MFTNIIGLLKKCKKKINFCRLATISGIPYTTIKSIIYGQSKNPGITTIKKICDGLEISVTDFFDTETFKNGGQENKKIGERSTDGRPYVVERKYRRGDYQSSAITKKRWKFEISNAFFIYFIFSFINAISSLTRKVGK